MIFKKEQFFTKADVEAVADWVRAEFFGSPATSSITLPVEPDTVAEAERVRLTVEWDVIEEPRAMREARARDGAHGHLVNPPVILAALYARTRRIVMNDNHADLFRANEGLYRFTVAHEIGHWFLHIDHAQLDDTTPSLFGDETALTESETITCRDGDDTWIERQANWFAAALLMPRHLVAEMAVPAHLRNWEARYELAGQFGVTISALNNRLRDLGIGDADEQKRLYNSPSERVGQLRLK